MIGQIGIRTITVHTERLGNTLARLYSAHRNGLVNSILCHQTIGRPLTTGNSNQVVIRNNDLMAARYLLGALTLFLGRCQGSLTGKHRYDILTRRRRIHIQTGRIQNKINLLFQCLGLTLRVLTQDICCSHHNAVVPRNSKQYATIGGLRNH